MTGSKKLKQIRAELEAALGSKPAGDSEIASALRRVIEHTQPTTRKKAKRARSTKSAS